MEQWKPIVGFEKYEISDAGRVRSLQRSQVLIVKLHVHKQTGYLRVNLRSGGVKKHRKVHRLVALAFLPNPENKPEVNHRNLNKLDCAISNLEWATSYENNMHAIDAGVHHIHQVDGKFATLSRG